jgi:uncharacterized phage protein (TIGR02218 family)
MKATVAPYETRAICLRIVCTNGLTIRLTRYPTDLTMSNATVYQTGSGYDLTAITASSNFSPSAIDLEGILGFCGITRDVIASGTFDNARAYLFACDFLNPVEDYEPLLASMLGKATLMDDRYVVEEIGLIDLLGQPVGNTYAALCSHSFGDARCAKNLAPLTVTGNITHVTSNYAFRDSGRAEAADYFTAGTVAFTSGLNSGLKPMEIMAHAADGSIQTFEPFHYLPAVGDAYTMIPGCRKRKADCQAWNNVDNAMAFWDIPSGSDYSQIGGK